MADATARPDKEMAVADTKKLNPKNADILVGAMKFATGSTGVELEEAVWQMDKRVQVFRGSDLVTNLLKSNFAKPDNPQYCIENRADAEVVCRRMMQEGYFFRVGRQDVRERIWVEQWPPHAQRFADDAEAFFVDSYEGPKTLRFFMGVGILVVFFLLCLFPVWPMSAKLLVRDGSRYILLVLLGVLLPLTVIRPVMAGLTGWWFLPNLWAENTADSICEELCMSFRPVWQAPCKSRSGGTEILKTTAIVLVLLVVGYFLVIIDIGEKEEVDKDFDFEAILSTEDQGSAFDGSSGPASAPDVTTSDEPAKPVDPSWEDAPEVPLKEEEVEAMEEDEDAGDIMKHLLRDKRADEIREEMTPEGMRKAKEERKNRKKKGFSSRSGKKN